MKNKFLTYFANKMPYIVCYLTFFCISIIFANAQNYVSQQRIKKIVIDAGHGGKDPGARGKNINEKDITLSVALKFGEFINKNFPEIEVIFTRNKDVFIELNERTNIANRNNADLFISIHINSFKNSTPRGVSTWIMGGHKSQANLEVSRLENSVITMEDDYTTKYQGFDPTSPESYIIFSLMQFAHRTESVTLAEFVQQELLQTSPLKGDKGVQQAGFLVLWKTAMPSILIELGFISNPNDEQILADADNQTKIAKSIFSAFSKYKQQYEKYNNTSQTTETAKPEKTEEKPVAATKNNSDSIKEKTAEKPVAETKNNSDSIKEKIAEKPVAETKNNSDSIKEKTAEKIPEKNNVADEKKQEQTVSVVNEKPATPSKPKKTYSVQIMAINKIISTTAKDFKGYKNVRYMKIGNYYKYITGDFENISDARKLCSSLQKDFKGAFVVAVEGNNLTPAR